jgi:pimeloyl-ACP methyl ester carboxylesterase
VSVSGAAVTVREQVLHELANTVGAAGGPEAVDVARELMEMAFAYGTSGAGWDDYLAGVEAAPPALAGAFPTARDDWRWAWYARVLDFDPLPLWKALARPSLVVYGAEDEHDNVPVAESVARLRAAGRAGLEHRVYPGSGHALDDPEGTWIRRDFLDELARWITAVPARQGG